MPNEALPCAAGGNIYPYSFVKLSTTPSTLITNATGFVVVQATDATAPVVGISQRGNRYAPWTALDDGLAAKVGEDVGVFVTGQICEIVMAATCTASQFIKPTTNGQGTPVTTDGDYYGAQALQACTAVGQLIWARVQPGQQAS
jgi:hypothetical protein